MSENTQDKKVIVVANLKSPVVGFVLALFLGWLGVDRFYKGGVLSILLGIIKLILGIFMFFKVVLAAFFLFAGSELGEFLLYLMICYAVWYVLDLILVPLGIVLDNRRKLAIAKNMGNAPSNAKILAIQAGIVVGVVGGVLLLLLLLAVAVPRFVATGTDAQVAMARSDMVSAQRTIVAKISADNIDTTKPKAPNGKSWGEWIITISELDTSKWAVSGNGIYPKGCNKETPLLWINTKTGAMHFNPSKLQGKKFCENLRDSYVTSNSNGDKIVPLVGSGNIKF